MMAATSFDHDIALLVGQTSPGVSFDLQGCARFGGHRETSTERARPSKFGEVNRRRGLPHRIADVVRRTNACPWQLRNDRTLWPARCQDLDAYFIRCRPFQVAVPGPSSDRKPVRSLRTHLLLDLQVAVGLGCERVQDSPAFSAVSTRSVRAFAGCSAPISNSSCRASGVLYVGRYVFK